MINGTKEQSVNRTYKSRLFELVFSDKSELLKLYNAINGTRYTDSGLLEINTLENAIYMSMHNDLSFIIDLRLTLYEHQSTYSPNLPLRFLFYAADLYSAITKDVNLYGHKLVKIPTPRFVIFYNGTETLMDACKTLKDYSEYTERVRKYAHTMDIELAVELAITECIKEGILAEFLKKTERRREK